MFTRLRSRRVSASFTNQLTCELTAAVLLCSLCPGQASAAPQTAVRDPQAVTVVNSALQALSGSTAVTDITLLGNATYIAGSDQETVPAVMKGLGTTSSSVELGFAAGSITEIRNYAFAPRAAVWIGGDGAAHPIPLHNCWTDAVWFYPALGTLDELTDAQVSFVSLGAATFNGVPVLHVRSYRILSNQDPDIITLVQTMSTTDVYLDPASYLPEFVTFNTHPDSDFQTAIPVEVDFADYRTIAGARVPFHMRRFEAGVLKLDFMVAGAAVNSGLSATGFVVRRCESCYSFASFGRFLRLPVTL